MRLPSGFHRRLTGAEGGLRRLKARRIVKISIMTIAIHVPPRGERQGAAGFRTPGPVFAGLPDSARQSPVKFPVKSDREKCRNIRRIFGGRRLADKKKLPGGPNGRPATLHLNMNELTSRLRPNSVGLGSTHGANVRAAAALRAKIRVDLVFAVTLGDSGNGAFRLTGTTSDAVITNFISHCNQAPPFYVRYHHTIPCEKINW
jgi:hypothetical protein